MGRVLRSKWNTAGLDANNAFTTSLVLRAAGILVRARLLAPSALQTLRRDWKDVEPKSGEIIQDKCRKFNSLTLPAIAALIAESMPKSLSVQSYPPTSAIGYWLLDAVSLLGINLDEQQSTSAVSWVVREFSRQVSLASANDHARMDPVAMAMAACVCRLLRRLSKTCAGIGRVLSGEASPETSLAGDFPTLTELKSAVYGFLDRQNDAGIWEKYFPLFHYPRAGANHCWHFEVLEAILHEFPEIIQDESVIGRIEKAIDWLDKNRLRWNGATGEFRGWNSGADIPTLETGQPESWPTGVAHMFLWRLRNAISLQTRDIVLTSYRDRVKRFPAPSHVDWDKYLDCELPGQTGRRSTVKGMLEIEVLNPAEATVRKHHERSEAVEEEHIGPGFRLGKRRSALLFGPPGTSKTSLAEAVAKRLGWPFVELSPSDFLKRGLAGIYDRVNEVFDDLMDLFGVVILFDEMDALVQSREEVATAEWPKKAENAQVFLTTSMLPKLLKLRKNGRVIFFMATNHQRDFDPAIKRSGRFDLLIRMGPPSYDEKFRGLGLDYWYREEETPEDRKKARELFQRLTTPKPVKDALALFTFGEMQSLLEAIRHHDEPNENLRAGLEKISPQRLQDLVKDLCDNQIALRKGSAALAEFQQDEKEIRCQ